MTGDPFYGEVIDQNGEVRIHEGTDATYEELISLFSINALCPQKEAP